MTKPVTNPARIEKTAIALLLTLATLPALAHPGHGADTVGFTTGLAHPFTGLDHLLAMLAVGLWSATTTRRIWLAPLSFAGMLLVGALLAVNGLVVPAVEPVITASVLVLGLLIMARVRLPESISIILVGSFALFHGAAHGAELGNGFESMVALIGMVIATALLHGTGIGAGLWIKARNLWWQRSLGAGIACTGASLALNLL